MLQSFTANINLGKSQLILSLEGDAQNGVMSS